MSKLQFPLSVPNEWFFKKGNIGYDSVRPWLARYVVSYFGEAGFVDFLLAGGVSLCGMALLQGVGCCCGEAMV